MPILPNSHQFNFPLKEFNSDKLPPQSQVIPAALEFVKQIKVNWTKTKVYPHDVHTYTNRQENDFWMARVSYHKDVTFEQFRKGILENHTVNEIQYIPLLDSVRTHEDEPAVIPASHPEGWKGKMDLHKVNIWYCF